MCIRKLLYALLAATTGTFLPAAKVHADDATIIGRVARGSDASTLRVCFMHAVEITSGQELTVIRHIPRSSSPKAGTVYQSAHVGVLRIATPGDDHCAGAVLVSGSAKWLDWVSIKAS